MQAPGLETEAGQAGSPRVTRHSSSAHDSRLPHSRQPRPPAEEQMAEPATSKQEACEVLCVRVCVYVCVCEM